MRVVTITGKLRFTIPALVHIGITIRDLRKAIEYYSEVFALGTLISIALYCRKTLGDGWLYQLMGVRGEVKPDGTFEQNPKHFHPIS